MSRPVMKLRAFSLKAKKIFDSYAQDEPRELSGYSFINQFVWRCLYDIRFHEARGRFCLFFHDKAGCFMPLPPLGKKDAATVFECFGVMDALNRNPAVSRIEHIEVRDTAFYENCGFQVVPRFCDYVVKKEAISFLRGRRLRHRRNLYNFFIKHHQAVFRDYRPKDRRSVEALLGRWKTERLARHPGRFFAGMLDDSERAFRELLDCLVSLGVRAKVVEIGGALVAFTSGVALNRHVFCVNFEIVDHRHKGLAQYIFTQFARTLDAEEINMMDDSGIASLKKSKLLFGDVRRIRSFAALRKTTG